MGTTRVIIPGNFPIGCFPYILTEFGTDDPADYDNLGCLRNINDLITYKNTHLRSAVTNLTQEFPNVTIFYGDFNSAYIRLLNETNAGKCLFHSSISLKYVSYVIKLEYLRYRTKPERFNDGLLWNLWSV